MIRRDERTQELPLGALQERGKLLHKRLDAAIGTVVANLNGHIPRFVVFASNADVEELVSAICDVYFRAIGYAASNVFTASAALAACKIWGQPVGSIDVEDVANIKNAIHAAERVLEKHETMSAAIGRRGSSSYAHAIEGMLWGSMGPATGIVPPSLGQFSGDQAALQRLIKQRRALRKQEDDLWSSETSRADQQFRVKLQEIGGKLFDNQQAITALFAEADQAFLSRINERVVQQIVYKARGWLESLRRDSIVSASDVRGMQERDVDQLVHKIIDQIAGARGDSYLEYNAQRMCTAHDLLLGRHAKLKLDLGHINQDGLEAAVLLDTISFLYKKSGHDFFVPDGMSKKYDRSACDADRVSRVTAEGGSVTSIEDYLAMLAAGHSAEQMGQEERLPHPGNFLHDHDPNMVQRFLQGNIQKVISGDLPLSHYREMARYLCLPWMSVADFDAYLKNIGAFVAHMKETGGLPSINLADMVEHYRLPGDPAVDDVVVGKWVARWGHIHSFVSAFSAVLLMNPSGEQPCLGDIDAMLCAYVAGKPAEFNRTMQCFNTDGVIKPRAPFATTTLLVIEFFSPCLSHQVPTVAASAVDSGGGGGGGGGKGRPDMSVRSLPCLLDLSSNAADRPARERDAQQVLRALARGAFGWRVALSSARKNKLEAFLGQLGDTIQASFRKFILDVLRDLAASFQRAPEEAKGEGQVASELLTEIRRRCEPLLKVIPSMDTRASAGVGSVVASAVLDAEVQAALEVFPKDPKVEAFLGQMMSHGRLFAPPPSPSSR